MIILANGPCDITNEKILPEAAKRIIDSKLRPLIVFAHSIEKAASEPAILANSLRRPLTHEGGKGLV